MNFKVRSNLLGCRFLEVMVLSFIRFVDFGFQVGPSPIF